MFEFLREEMDSIHGKDDAKSDHVVTAEASHSPTMDQNHAHTYTFSEVNAFTLAEDQSFVHAAFIDSPLETIHKENHQDVTHTHYQINMNLSNTSSESNSLQPGSIIIPTPPLQLNHGMLRHSESRMTQANATMTDNNNAATPYLYNPVSVPVPFVGGSPNAAPAEVQAPMIDNHSPILQSTILHPNTAPWNISPALMSIPEQGAFVEPYAAITTDVLAPALYNQPSSQWSITPSHVYIQHSLLPSSTVESAIYPNISELGPLAPIPFNRTPSELSRQATLVQDDRDGIISTSEKKESFRQIEPTYEKLGGAISFRSMDPSVERLGGILSFRSMELPTAVTTAAPSFRYIEGASSSIGKISFRGEAFTSPLDDPDFCPRPQFKSIQDAQYLAAHAPQTASPLPDQEKITHSGSILSRISLRSIFFKSWKPVVWITYGPYAIYFFRSNSDLEAWAMNPYLSQGQRDFLVKLKIDFVNDLNKAGVRSYEATALKYKQYKSEMLYV